MPELPEVETTRRGIAPHCEGQTIEQVKVRNGSLRWPVPGDLAAQMNGQVIRTVERRAKYLFLNLDHGTAIVHLGMSGSLRIITDDAPAEKHDHIDLVLHSGVTLRFNDPRRFGCWLWADSAETHPLIASLGPEPLSAEFTGRMLFQLSRSRNTPVKSFIMDSHVVVGVGNIYANEALFHAGIHPKRKAGRISLDRYQRLAEAIREILSAAILMGGTTLRDFVNSDGKPGYFAQSLLVYGRAGEPCPNCETPLKEIRMNGRSTVYCTGCQR
ncbi:bifunctional DNA-formamidopyrimidine glycosylase/DNA-(apurinic or apyrimidinic site) lyase [Marinobacter sp. DY40_1A1]|uniref:bifunctional DNA-formamidopyrimidine glycosylase/DNA-(apurinic or apyrimidinic site) lyase n=1 Tax=Marinobacter sp. DY40_1A1 TaxID=2583229 RepID=UPI001908D6C7|nr:bifunctional DNA-formamidopyrimidine glycosylase/DNA-(apurinic or apyrimidinic site) lyase [Marinobacter sp. DY40_1A1]MBK1886516.1 bifunctional DNA-formamidopyrimidine glycosylase/DNA-(apurinic or apyrimidinic site) lyase [Marinobacter sp. DY40_1A1]